MCCSWQRQSLIVSLNLRLFYGEECSCLWRWLPICCYSHPQFRTAASFTCHSTFQASYSWPSDTMWKKANLFKRPMHLHAALSFGLSTKSASSNDSTRKREQNWKRSKQLRKRANLRTCWTCSKTQLWFSAQRRANKCWPTIKYNHLWFRTKLNSRTCERTISLVANSLKCLWDSWFFHSSLQLKRTVCSCSNSSQTRDRLMAYVRASMSPCGLAKTSMQMVLLPWRTFLTMNQVSMLKPSSTSCSLMWLTKKDQMKTKTEIANSSSTELGSTSTRRAADSSRSLISALCRSSSSCRRRIKCSKCKQASSRTRSSGRLPKLLELL